MEVTDWFQRLDIARLNISSGVKNLEMAEESGEFGNGTFSGFVTGRSQPKQTDSGLGRQTVAFD